MRRALLDEQFPRELAGELTGVDAETVHDRKWDGAKNGELLRRAAPDYAVFVTMDKNLRHQQDLRTLPFGVVLVRARTNRIEDLRPLIPELVAAIAAAKPGALIEVGTSAAKG